MRLTTPDDRVGHAEIKIGDSRFLLADEFPESEARSPQPLGGSPVHLLLYFEDLDVALSRAVAAGLTLTSPEVTSRDMQSWLRGKNLNPVFSTKRETELIRISRRNCAA
jgi:hypothetical protein